MLGLKFIYLVYQQLRYSALNSNKNQPKLDIEKSSYIRNLEYFAWGILAFITGYLILNYSNIQDRIPTHFNFKGEADGHGDKSTLWLFIILLFGLHIMMTTISKYPHSFNYIVKITEKNARKQYGIAINMLFELNLCIMIFLSYGIYSVMKSSLTESTNMNIGSSFIFLIPFAIIIFRSIVLSNRHQ